MVDGFGALGKLLLLIPQHPLRNRVNSKSITARWVDAEALHLKRLGMSYQAIADHIMGVAHGKQQAAVPLPEHASFSENYRISAQAFHEAFQRGLVRLPNGEAVELRKLDNERCEDMFLSLQAGMRKGDPRSVEVAVKVLVHKAYLNGYRAPAKVEMTGKQGGPLAIETFRKLCEEAEDEGVEDEHSNGDSKTE
jgi:hypothetical protein